jgi:hypothetical protein
VNLFSHTNTFTCGLNLVLEAPLSSTTRAHFMIVRDVVSAVHLGTECNKRRFDIGVLHTVRSGVWWCNNAFGN